MADIQPFKGFRYSESAFRPENLIFQNNSEIKLDFSNQDNIPYHSSKILHQASGTSYTDILGKWIKSEVLLKESEPAFYTFQESYKSPLTGQSIERLSFICLLELDNSILEHENTSREKLEKLEEYYSHCPIQSNPIMAFYNDNDQTQEIILRNSLNNKLYEFSTDGINVLVGKIIDTKEISYLQNRLKHQKVYLADGHHRYNALKNRKGIHPQVLTLLINEAISKPEVYPYQRIYSGFFDKTLFLNKLREDFDTAEIDCDDKIQLFKKKWAIKLFINNKCYLASLRPEQINLIDWDLPEKIKTLDQTVINYFIFEKYLGIPGSEQKNSASIKICSIFTDYRDILSKKQVELAVIVDKIELETIKSIADSGLKFPYKSSFFYPKTISGLLFASES